MRKFSDVFEFRDKSRIKAGDGLPIGKYPFYTSSNEQSKWYDDFLFEGDSLIFGTGGGASVHFNNSRFLVTADCLVAQPKTKGFLAKFYYYYLKENIRVLENGFKGAGLKHISKGYISEIDFPEIDYKSQQKIVTILDQADALRKKRQESLRLLDEYLKSVFLEMFGNLEANSKNWSIKKLSEISMVVSGVTKGRKFCDVKTVTVPYMRVANVQDGHILLNEIKEIEVLPEDVEKYRLQLGDILLTEGGDPDKLGRGAVWLYDIKDCIHQNHIFRVRIRNKTEIIPVFLSTLIGTAYGKKYFLKAAKQTTGIATINSTQLKDFPVMIPKIDLQIKYASIVKKIEQQKQKVTQSLTELDNLFNSLSQRYFG